MEVTPGVELRTPDGVRTALRELLPLPFAASLEKSRQVARAEAADRTGLLVASVFYLAALLGVAIRLGPALSAAFPVGDGGMFYVMVNEILRNHFALPQFTSYNSAHIPFDYPPVGLYLVAAIHAVFGVPLLSIFRLEPAVVSVLTLGAFFLLARTVLPTPGARAAAFLVFSVSISSYQWEVQGGGVTRSVGLLFALLALQQIARVYMKRDARSVLPAAVLCALTGLSHLEWAWFLACSAIALFCAYGRNRDGLRHTLVLVVATAALLAPWFGTVVVRHGISPFLATMVGSEQGVPWYFRLRDVLMFNLSDQGGFAMGVAAALVGALACARRRDYLLPAWVVATYLATSRAPTDKVIIPLALLAGVGVAALPGTLGLSESRSESSRLRAPIGVVIIVALAVLQVAFTGTLAAATTGGSLSRSDLAAMNWIRHHTSPSAHVLVVSPVLWGDNDQSEWLPALTGRESVAGVQGFEWLPGQFATRLKRYSALARCATKTSACLDTWLRRTGTSTDYLYVPRDARATDGTKCCSGIAWSLRRDRRYSLVFVNPAAEIFRVRPR